MKTSIYQLILGDFEKDEAKKLLTDLYASKIKFHSLRALSYEEETGIKSEYHEYKIKELRGEKDRLIKELSLLKLNQVLHIDSKIELRLSEDELN